MQIKENEQAFNLLNMAILILSVYVLGALLIDLSYELPSETSRLLNIIDFFICIIFLLEFIFRFIKSENKLSFMRLGWIDLISSIPTVDILRYGRLIRLIRLIRLFRALKAFRLIYVYFVKERVKSAFASATIFAILVLIFSSIAVLQVENDPNSNIKTAEDAIWWAYTTITTVGYGDKFPVTTEGRILAMILMTTGVGLFGVFTGFVATWLIGEKKEVD